MDDQLRELERARAAGDAEAGLALVRERRRRGLADDRPTCKALHEAGVVPPPGWTTRCCWAEAHEFGAPRGTARGRPLELQCARCDGYGWDGPDGPWPAWPCVPCGGLGRVERLVREEPLRWCPHQP